jgi:hypothetical protein
MAHNRRDDDLAYGDYHGDEGVEGDRGLIGDMGRRLFGGSRKEVRSTTSLRNAILSLYTLRTPHAIELL